MTYFTPVLQWTAKCIVTALHLLMSTLYMCGLQLKILSGLLYELLLYFIPVINALYKKAVCSLFTPAFIFLIIWLVFAVCATDMILVQKIRSPGILMGLINTRYQIFRKDFNYAHVWAGYPWALGYWLLLIGIKKKM